MRLLDWPRFRNTTAAENLAVYPAHRHAATPSVVAA
jgi:hypothetical protein